MTFVQGNVAAVPTANKDAYRVFAEACAEIFKSHGAIEVRETWGFDVPGGETTSFPLAVQCKPDETVVFSWVEWPSKEACDKAWEAMVPEFETRGLTEMPFDGKRMIYGGFETLVKA